MNKSSALCTQELIPAKCSSYMFLYSQCWENPSFFFFFFMFNWKCFSGTNQNKQNPISLSLVAPLPKRVQWHSICLRCYWRHSAFKCSSTDVLLCCGIWKTYTTGLEERKKPSFEQGGKYLIFSPPDLSLKFSGTFLCCFFYFRESQVSIYLY